MRGDIFTKLNFILMKTMYKLNISLPKKARPVDRLQSWKCVSCTTFPPSKKYNGDYKYLRVYGILYRMGRIRLMKIARIKPSAHIHTNITKLDIKV